MSGEEDGQRAKLNVEEWIGSQISLHNEMRVEKREGGEESGSRGQGKG